MVDIYDWRRSIRPSAQLFVAGGISSAGGLSLGGASAESPAPGGRATLFMDFNTLPRSGNVAASWTYSRVLNGGVFRIPLRCTDQLVRPADLLPPGTDGIPWAGEQPWASGENWDWSPWCPISAPASKGAVQVVADLSIYGAVVQPGHVVGFSAGRFDFAHIVMDVAYDAANVASLTVEPPLRRAVTTDSRLLFRPSMMVTCRNPAEVAGMFTHGRFTKPGSGRFVEALL